MSDYGAREGGLASLAIRPPEHLQMLRDSVDAFTRRHGGVGRVREHRGGQPGFDRAVWGEMAEAGWIGLFVPEAAGGLGLGHVELAVLSERLGKALGPEPYASSAVFAPSILADAENAELRDRLLPRVLSGQLVAAVAWQEGSPGPGVADQTRTTRLDPSDGCLYGTKCLVAPVAGADGFVVSVATSEGQGLCWIDRDAPGLRCEQDLLVDGGFAGRLHFDHVAVGRDALIARGASASRAIERAVDRALLAASAEMVGVMSEALDLTLDYLRARTQFGRPIASFQAIQHRLADLFVQQRLACASVLNAAYQLDRSDDDIAGAAAVSAAKARCGTASLTITRQAIQLYGAMGFTDECDIGLFLKRALVLAAWLGNSAFHRRRFARLSPTPDAG